MRVRNLSRLARAGVIRRTGSLAIVGLLGALAFSQRQEESIDYYQRWLDRDVVYIISEEERSVFEKLTTSEEQDNFIEQFWRRRDPGAGASENEFKLEHYRRIAYANERFSTGIEGWATDRGRAYIMFGPPRSIDRNPTGEYYMRSAAEGGGKTFNYPYEVWYYDHIEGIGAGITLEFVDSSFTGKYQLALHPYEKDALLDKPGQGLTLAEAEGLVSKQARLETLFMQRPSRPEGHTWADMTRQPFESLQRYFDLRRPPEFKNTELQQLVATRVTFPHDASLEADFSYQYFYLDGLHALVPVCLAINSSQLTVDQQESRVVRIDVYGRVTDLLNRSVYEFEDSLEQEKATGSSEEVFLYERKLPLAPGRYKLTAALKDAGSGRIAVVEEALLIPAFDPEALGLGSLNLISGLQEVRDDLPLTDPFVIAGGFRAFPQLNARVERSQRFVGLHFEVYNFAIAQDTHLPQVGVTFTLYDRNGRALRQEPLPRSAFRLVGNRIVVLHQLEISSLAPGTYRLEASVFDAIARKEIARETGFTVAGDDSG